MAWSGVNYLVPDAPAMEHGNRGAICLPLNTRRGGKRVIYIWVSGRPCSRSGRNEIMSLHLHL